MSLYTFLHFVFMAGAVLMLIAAVKTSRKRSGTAWLSRHRTLALAGAAAGIAGFLIIYFYKTAMGYPHFHSPHAMGGAITLIIVVVSSVAGLLLISGKQFIRKPHRFLGYAAGAMAVLVAFSGVVRFLQISQII